MSDWLIIIAIACAITFMLIVGVGALRDLMRKQREPRTCSHYDRCEECQ